MDSSTTTTTTCLDAGAFLESLVPTMSSDEAVDKLTSAVTRLDSEIDDRVRNHYEELLGQATALRDATAMIREISDALSSLQRSISRVRDQLLLPYTQIKSRTSQLQSLHSSAECLRFALRQEQLIRRVRTEETANDIVKSSSTLREVSNLSPPKEYSSSRRQTTSKEYITQCGERISSAAEKLLSSGVESLNQSDVSNALQALRNLDKLDDSVSRTLDQISERAAQGISASLSETSLSSLPPSPSHSPSPPSSPHSGARQQWWSRVVRVGDAVSAAVGQAWALGAALQKTTDVSTGEPVCKFLKNPSQANPVGALWRNLSRVVSERLSATVRQTPQGQSSVVAEYPRLLKAWTEFVARLGPSLSGVQDAEELMMQPLAPYERLWLSQELSRLIEHVNAAASFDSAGGSSSSAVEAMQGMERCIAGQLEAARLANPRFVEEVSKHVVAKGLRHLAARVEQQISTGPEAWQVREKMNAKQVLNAAAFQCLVTAHALVAPVTGAGTWLSPAAVQHISSAQEELETLALSCVGPLFDNSCKVLESCLYLMHSEDFAGDLASSGQSPSSPSAYMSAFEKQLRHLQVQFISRLAPCPLLSSQVSRLCARMATVFVRQASLLRPLEPRGKIRLAADMAQLELSLGRLQPASSASSSPAYRQLRALRPLLYRETSEIRDCPEASQLPPSVVIHHLFSRAPDCIPSPHVCAKMSLVQYNDWLDKNSESEIWVRVRSTLSSQTLEFARTIESAGDHLVQRWRQNI